MAQAPLIISDLPLNSCWPSNPQTFIDWLKQLGYALVPDNSQGVVYAPVAPSDPANARLWFNTNDHRIYEYNSNFGLWTSLYWVPTDTPFKMIWEGTEAALAAWENPGGTVGQVVTAISGPFWEVDHNYDGRSVMGPGAISGEDVTVKTLGLSEAYGSGSHIQLPTELAQHTHLVEFADATPGSTYAHYSYDSGDPDGSIHEPLGQNNGTNETTMIAQASNIAPVAMQNVHPVRGAFLAKRTARTSYTHV